MTFDLGMEYDPDSFHETHPWMFVLRLLCLVCCNTCWGN